MGVPFDHITMNEAMEKVKEFLAEDKLHTIYTPNAEIVMAALREPELNKVLCEADMLIADGAGVVLASNILKTPLPEKVSGLDLIKNSFSELRKSGTSYFFLGGTPGVAETAAINVLHDHPGIRIAGYRNGYFTEQEEDGIIEQINASNADILLVAFGAPKQEFWIHRNRYRLKAKICIGCGGTLDVLSGKTEPTPEFMRRHGFEWLHRLYKEPKRFKRMLDLPRFMMRVMAARLTGK